jgi:uncharacterized protein (DUF302 family)
MFPVSESLAPHEMVEHSMSRITLVGPGSYDDFQARLESVLPSSTPQDVMAKVKTWQDAIELIEAKAPFGLLIYRKGDVYSAMKLAGHDKKCAYYFVGNFTVAEKGFAVHPSVFQFFPFHVCIWEGSDGRPRIAMDQPSSALAIFDDPTIAEVGREFDRRFGRLLQHLGCEVPDGLL